MGYGILLALYVGSTGCIPSTKVTLSGQAPLSPASKPSGEVEAPETPGVAAVSCSPFGLKQESNPDPATYDFSFSASGPCHVFPGHSLYFNLHTRATTGSGSGKNIYYTVEGLPEGATHRFPKLEVTCCAGGRFQYSPGTTPIMISFPADTAPGEYTLRITATSVGIEKTLEGRIVVDPAPAIVTPKPVSQNPPIPMLATWESNMLRYGERWCNREEILNYGIYDASVQYYDGQRVFHQIAQYTKNDAWYACGGYVEEAYRDGYVLPNNAAIPGFRVFPHGSFLEFKRTAEPEAERAVVLLATRSPYNSTMDAIDTNQSREVAYALMAKLLYRDLGYDPGEALPRLVDLALGHLSQWGVSGTASSFKPFMVGLTMEALIQYYAKSKDPRVPALIRPVLDEMWEKLWGPNLTADSPIFAGCASAPNLSRAGFLYIDRWKEGDGSPCSGSAPDLNLLIAPAYAWMYKMTGEAKYQEQADAIFVGGVQHAWISGRGKIFSQVYRWSFDFVKWRSLLD